MLIQQGEDYGACTVTKIAENFIITAAHCLHGKTVLDLALSNLTENSMNEFSPLKLEKIYIHPDYELLSALEGEAYESSFSNLDLALVKVKPSPEFQKLEIVKINFDLITLDHKVDFWGYGCQETINDIENYIPVRKRATGVTLDKSELEIGHKLMTDYYSEKADSIYDLNLITPGKGKDPLASSLCLGDSGGPVLLDGKLVGINTNYTFDDINPEDPEAKSSGISYLNIHARLSKVKDWVGGILGN